MLSFVIGTKAQTTNGMSAVEIQGQALAQKIIAQRPAIDSEETGVLKIRNSNGVATNISISCKVTLNNGNWEAEYVAGFQPSLTNSPIIPTFTYLEIAHINDQSNIYSYRGGSINDAQDRSGVVWIPLLNKDQINRPFAGSDFWISDLGLEFLHWPAQKVLKKEVHSNRNCTVLESTNPDPSPGGYSRVLSWIDNESLGIAEAYAYDVQGRQLKDFYPKDFKKVNGQWQVQTLVMENVQTGSRSRIVFDLKK